MKAQKLNLFIAGMRWSKRWLKRDPFLANEKKFCEIVKCELQKTQSAQNWWKKKLIMNDVGLELDFSKKNILERFIQDIRKHMWRQKFNSMGNRNFTQPNFIIFK